MDACGGDAIFRRTWGRQARQHTATAPGDTPGGHIPMGNGEEEEEAASSCPVLRTKGPRQASLVGVDCHASAFVSLSKPISQPQMG